MANTTVRDVFNAMEKNGYRKARGIFYRRSKASKYASKLGPIISACAIGQAALNLNIPPNVLQHALTFVDHRLTTEIIRLNDTTTKTVPEIAKELRIKYVYVLSRELSL